MSGPLISESDFVGLNNFVLYLERFPAPVESFLKNFSLAPLQSGQYPLLNEVTARAKRDAPLWPETKKQLRKFHQDVTLLINDARELVTQLGLYKRPEETDSTRENLNTLALHATPFNMNGKLGISPSSKTYDVTYVLSNALNNFDNLLYKVAKDMEQIQQSTSDIFPRTTDFMRVKITEHETLHRKPDSTFPEHVRKELEVAKRIIEASNSERFDSVEAANNMLAYCTRIRTLLNDAKSQLLRISDMSTVMSFMFQMRSMDNHLAEAQDLINQAHKMI